MTDLIKLPGQDMKRNISPSENNDDASIQIDATLSRTGYYYYLRTPVELSGHGIYIVNNDNGNFKYMVTHRAFEKLKCKYTINTEYLRPFE